ncbi:MAG: LysM peptidoglycan-binding domain-containing protein [Phycisphaerales bacterium]|nr:LysM peptidoglycan-binding domain-containing protein [Phycisphaerales bacterium]
MGKETKVGLLVGMCFIVCCAIVLSHHGRRRAEAQDLSVTNAERSRKAPLLLDRNASAERATKRIAPSRTTRPNTRNNRADQPDQFDDEPAVDDRVHEDQETQLADSRSSGDGRWETPTRESQSVRYGFESEGERSSQNRTSQDRDAASRPSSRSSEPFIHRGPPIPDVVAPKTSRMNERNDELVVLDDASQDSEPLVANMPSGDNSGFNRRTLTSTPSPAPKSRRESRSDSAASHSAPTRTESDATDQIRAEMERVAARNAARDEAESNSGRSNEAHLQSENRQSGNRPAGRAAMDRHVVQEGENLSRIAEQYYGSSAPAILDAIVQANRDTMSGPNHIVAGRELLLPEIAGIDAIRHAESPDDEESQVGRDVDADRERPAQSKIAAEYEVQPGDQLSRVVSRHYGSSSQRIIDEVYRANMDRMKSPDNLVAGTVIVLPEIDNIQPKQVGQSQKAHDEPVARTASDEEAFQWYVVQKGDTYSTIAAAQMGSSKRWRELADFNKTVFKDATQIRHGVRIRIPTGSSSSRESDSNRRGR